MEERIKAPDHRGFFVVASVFRMASDLQLTQMRIRRAKREDCVAILSIYNHAVLHTTASYDYEPRTLEHRFEWFEAHAREDMAIFVAEAGPEGIVGWSALNKYHDRIGFRFTAENSVYVAEMWRGRGLGGLLLKPLIGAAEARGFHAILAAIDAENLSSIRLHAKHGFEKVGQFRQVGYKFGRWLDVVYMERLIGMPIPGFQGS